MIVEQGIQTLLNESGRPSGEALVVLESHEDVVKALNHNRQHMGSRYIEIMEISQQQYQDDMKQQPESVSYVLGVCYGHAFVDVNLFIWILMKHCIVLHYAYGC